MMFVKGRCNTEIGYEIDPRNPQIRAIERYRCALRNPTVAIAGESVRTKIRSNTAHQSVGVQPKHRRKHKRQCDAGDARGLQRRAMTKQAKTKKKSTARWALCGRQPATASGA